MMLSIGLSLSLADFKRIFIYPKPVFIGLILQLLALPAIAWALIIGVQIFTELHYSIAAGLIIIAACPSGATSNVISHLSGGNSALSVTLTAINSLIAPFVLPLSLTLQLGFLSATDNHIDLPILKTWLQLILVTLMPLILGMYLSYRFNKQTSIYQALITKLSGALLIVLIVFLVFSQWEQLIEQASLVIYLCLLLCSMSLLFSQLICKSLKFDASTRKTLAIEVCIQNAGTGMFIALVVLQQPELALLPLSYGILMNIPALLFIAHGQWQQKAPLPKANIQT
jgi:BASS family bile acid:Na+ symporter